MGYLFVVLEIALVFVFVITSYAIARILNDEGRAQKPLYSINDLVCYWNYARRQSSSYPRAVFWLCITSLVLILLIAFIADSYYH
jgi:hypothetical protein